MDGDSLKALVVVAHPDDEILGAGIWMSRRSPGKVNILHVTDGSPQDMVDARAHGFSSRADYAAARRRELLAALNLLKIPVSNHFEFPLRDKEAYLNLPALVAYLDLLVRILKPDLVLSCAYEGGHPDHDAVAFAAASVAKRDRSFLHHEFPLYHSNGSGEMVSGEFLEYGIAPRMEQVIEFTPEDRELKKKLLACFPSQAEILSCFRLDSERFRAAPLYDFTEPPHPGPLLYERWGWGISGASWRQQASEALFG